jgi:DNA polymerase-3 subunit alpha
MEETLLSFANPIGELGNNSVGAKVKVAGIITSISKILTRSNEPMLFATIEDTSARTEVLVFPKVLKKGTFVWQVDNIVLVQGRTNTKDGALKIIAEEAKELAIQQTLDKKAKKFTITLPAKSGKEKLLEIKKIILGFPGELPVWLKIPRNGDFREIKTKTKVSADKLMIEKLVALVGKENIAPE